MTRIDKYLWAVRLFKTRTQASEACKSQKVLINNDTVKSSRDVKKGDVISLKKNTAIFTYRIVELLENRVGAPLVKEYLEDITPIDQVEKQKEYLSAKKEFRDFTLGKPSKTDRRKLRNFLGD
jgi:ribosome-associated heat shock protein Hsp15